jgi:anti-sigma regulatory factor (Ser/Thr protein kinase)
MLAAAGMDCRVDAAASAGLAPDTGELLAWIVREGTTNAVRHSGARAVTITVTAAAGELLRAAMAARAGCTCHRARYAITCRRQSRS